MKEIKNDFIKMYQYKNYFIYIKETKNSYEYYIQHKDYCVIYMMIGINKKTNTVDDLLAIIRNNIMYDIDFYKSRYED